MPKSLWGALRLWGLSNCRRLPAFVLSMGKLTPVLQVSWCKLEVEVDAHKAITATVAENKCGWL